MSKQDSIGALWIKTTKSGEQFLTGTIGDKKVTVFYNKYKKEDKHPDYRIYETIQKESWPPSPLPGITPPAQAQQKAQAIKESLAPPSIPGQSEFFNNEDIPF